jgi:hypothetical protein
MLQCALAYKPQLNLDGNGATPHVDQAFTIKGVGDSQDEHKMDLLFVSGAADWL